MVVHIRGADFFCWRSRRRNSELAVSLGCGVLTLPRLLRGTLALTFSSAYLFIGRNIVLLASIYPGHSTPAFTQCRHCGVVLSHCVYNQPLLNQRSNLCDHTFDFFTLHLWQGGNAGVVDIMPAGRFESDMDSVSVAHVLSSCICIIPQARIFM